MDKYIFYNGSNPNLLDFMFLKEGEEPPNNSNSGYITIHQALALAEWIQKEAPYKEPFLDYGYVLLKGENE